MVRPIDGLPSPGLRLAAACPPPGLGFALAPLRGWDSRLSQFHIGADVRAGRRVPVLENFNPGEVERREMRVLLDFLVQHVQLGSLSD